ncbi:MAG: hypothetical protein DRJ36_01165, partial [Thermoprotei archaeon]
MRVLLITRWFPPEIGGVASHVRDLAMNLYSRGDRVTVFTASNVSCSDWPFEVIRVSPEEYLRVACKAIWSRNPFRDLMEVVDPDIVHVHHAFTPISLASLVSASLSRYPVILTNHSAYLYDYKYLLKALGYMSFPLKLIIDKADRIIAVSKAAARFIRAFAPSTSITVIPNGVDTDRFRPEGSRELRKAIGDGFIVLYVGRLVQRKGVLRLINAMGMVARNIPEVKLVIVGEGPLRMLIEKRVKELEVDKNVMLLGKVEDLKLPDLYRSADVLVMPSLYGESFGIVSLEAMASGLPVVATSTGGLKEIVINGVNGLLLRNARSESIAEKLIYLYRREDVRKNLSLNARRIAEERYSWDNVL